MPIFFVIFASFLLSMKGIFAKLDYLQHASVDASFGINKNKLQYHLNKSNKSDGKLLT